jgi:hypothetical protein
MFFGTSGNVNYQPLFPDLSINSENGNHYREGATVYCVCEWEKVDDIIPDIVIQKAINFFCK